MTKKAQFFGAHIPLQMTMVPFRQTHMLMYWRNDDLIVRSVKEQNELVLNAPAAFIWQHCDGHKSLRQIIDEVKHARPGVSDLINEEVSEAVKALFHQGLVDLKTGPVYPIARITFEEFHNEFNPRDNFFINLLSEWFDILLVEPGEQVDILIQSNQSGLRIAQTSSAFTMLVDEQGIVDDAVDFDVVFSTVESSDSDKAHQLRLPSDYQQNFSASISQKDHQVLDHLFPSVSRQKSTGKAKVTAKKTLTIGMATYDDYDGTYFSVQAIRMFHPEVTDETEILVIDNNPDGPCGRDLKKLESSVGGYRYIANEEIRGTAVRDFVFREARTDYVLCIDCHVFIEPGALRKLIDYFEKHPETIDLLQGPLVRDNLMELSTHFEPLWRNGMFGVWGFDTRGEDPDRESFEIPMQGLGLAACRREAWQGYNPRFQGFGGEEGYIHQKFRNTGAKTLCLPFLRWMHRFARPMGAKYKNDFGDRIRNYLIGFEEVGLDTSGVIAHFNKHSNKDLVNNVVTSLKNEKNNPFDFFDAIFCINLDRKRDRWSSMRQRLATLGILHRVRRFSAVETPESHHIGCALSHRMVVENAKAKGYSNVLVLEDDALFHQDAFKHLRNSVDELKHQSWNVFYLGGMKWHRKFENLPGCHYLERPVGMTCTHAIAYNAPFYDKLLNEIPANFDQLKSWLKQNVAIDQWMRDMDDLVVISPVIASQANILSTENALMRKDFH